MYTVTGKYLLPLILLLVLISGCTFPGTVSPVETGSGIVIKEFAPLFSEIYPNEPIKFNLKFKNIGSVKAEGVFAELLGIDHDWYDPSFTTGGDWLDGQKLPDQKACARNGEHGDLLSPNEQYGTEGGSMTCTWTYKAPDIPEGTNMKYDVLARVFYTYSTLTIKSITAGTQEQIKRYLEQGKQIPVSTVSTTRSPIKLSLSLQEPIRYWGTETEIPIKIEIQNVGGGTPCKKDACKKDRESEESWGKITVKITLGDGMSLSDECREFESGKELLILPNKENSVICKIKLTSLDKAGLDQRTIALGAEYSYFIDKQTSITII